MSLHASWGSSPPLDGVFRRHRAARSPTPRSRHAPLQLGRCMVKQSMILRAFTHSRLPPSPRTTQPLNSGTAHLRVRRVIYTPDSPPHAHETTPALFWYTLPGASTRHPPAAEMPRLRFQILATLSIGHSDARNPTRAAPQHHGDSCSSRVVTGAGVGCNPRSGSSWGLRPPTRARVRRGWMSSPGR